LSVGLARLKEGSTSGTLTVTVSPAFAAKWLMPKIEHFHQAYPETDLRLDTNLKAVDFLSGGIDVGVRYGSGEWIGLVAIKFMDEEIYPVCSPSFLKRHGPFAKPSALASHTLIHDLSMQNHTEFQTWRSWLDTAGFPHVESERGLQINNSAAVLQAAIDGQGVALGRSVMMRDDLAAGRLVRLFKTISSPSKLAYYIVYRAECAGLPRIAAFREWLLSEVS
jgi:LysR family glycine cleavage system transcriptional activator